MSGKLQSFNLDIFPQKNPSHVKVTQYDKGVDGWEIMAVLYRDGVKTAEFASGYTATIDGTTSEKTGFTVPAVIDSETGNVRFTLTDDMTAWKGAAWCKIVFSASGSQIATSGFWLDCDRAGVEAETVIGADGFDKRIDDAVDNRVDEVIGDYIPADVVSAAVSDWMDDHPEVIADPDLYTVKVKSHHYDGVGDTSWILLKIPREQFKLSFHNCSGTDSDSPTTLVSNPKAWLEEHLAYFLSHNCNFGGAEWGSRWNGTEYARNIDSTLYPTPRNYFAFDSETEECAYYPASVYDSTNLLAAIPARFDIVFACGDPFVLDGVPNTDFHLDGGTGTRTAFGWDDDYYYVLSGEGRGTYERGLTLDEVKAIFVANNVANAVNFDGGGSVCLAARIVGGVDKINRFRDCSLTYPNLRQVGLCAAYERRSAE